MMTTNAQFKSNPNMVRALVSGKGAQSIDSLKLLGMMGTLYAGLFLILTIGSQIG